MGRSKKPREELGLSACTSVIILPATVALAPFFIQFELIAVTRINHR
jgi:hypothetical protein